jgi:hypothetical protein
MGEENVDVPTQQERVQDRLDRPRPPGMLVVQVPGRPQISVPWDPHFIESVREFLKKERQALEEQATNQEQPPRDGESERDGKPT